MPTNTINTNRNHIDWPMNQRLEEPENRRLFFEALGLRAIDGQGNNINDQVSINDRQVNYQTVGEYPVFLTAVTGTGQELSRQVYLHIANKGMEYPTDSPQPEAKKAPAPNPAKPIKAGGSGRSKKGLIALLVILALIIGGFALHQHNVNRRAQEAQQSSATSQISGLQHRNQQLQDQIDQLKAAQKQYQQDHDQDALNSKLNQLQAENDQLKQQLSQREQADLDNLSRAINQIRQNPDQGQSIISQLDSGSGAQSYLGQLKDNIQSWLDAHQ